MMKGYHVNYNYARHTQKINGDIILNNNTLIVDVLNKKTQDLRDILRENRQKRLK